ncbi:hypothetical protein [Hyphomicrobium sp. DY-1]|uniref:hypothetical protein n=1 Tax=Hyphomicrobium sp. DY-1 TaxID=3075650 RepID=UPI0039C012A4
MTTTSAFEPIYRSYYASAAEPHIGFDDWMRANKSAFRALNPNTKDAQTDAAFRIFMFETYEGQLPRA